MVASTIGDDVVESEQTFSVELSTPQERVTLTINSTLVSIESDGKLIRWCLKWSLMIRLNFNQLLKNCYTFRCGHHHPGLG